MATAIAHMKPEMNKTYFAEPPEGGLDLVANRQGAIKVFGLYIPNKSLVIRMF